MTCQKRTYSQEELARYFYHWKLVADGSPFWTKSSYLQPVSYQGQAAMLKISINADEARGAQLMAWWDGQGAVKVLDYTDNALLLKRSLGNKSLIKMTRSGLDDQASKIICHVAACLHTPRKQCLPDLMPLSTCFEALMRAAKKHGGIFDDAASFARSLLAKPEEVVVLHGDLHHGNILDSGSQGWLAIDPKGFLGERGFDFANIFCNPDTDIATSPGRLMKQVMVVTKMAHLDQHRLLAWIVSWAALSAAWHIEDGEDPDTTLAVAKIALEALRLK